MSGKKIVSIVVPAFNEEKKIARAISELKKVSFAGQGFEKEIIVVSDGSTDRTEEILRKIKGITVISYQKNRGKGFALRQGFSKARGEIVAIQDADLEYDAKTLVRLIVEMQNGNKVVYGSRFMGKISGMSFSHRLGNLFLSAITSVLFGQRVTDMETCQKMFEKPLLDSLNLKSDRFDIEPELTAKVLMRGIKIKEIPIRYSARAKQLKKIKFADGVKAAATLFRLRFFG